MSQPAMHVVRVVALLLALSASLGAQQRLRVAADVRASPTGNVVATLQGGTTWPSGETRNGWTLLTIEGWIDGTRLAGPRDTFPQSLGGRSTIRIRKEPSLDGEILGEFRAGAGFRVLERRQNWARVRRNVWVSASVLAAPLPLGATPPPPLATATAAGSPAPNRIASAEPGLRAQQSVLLRVAPGGAPLGELVAGTVVVPEARDRGWVKVQVEGWVQESLFVPADSSYRAQRTAADLRTNPTGTRGQIVRWSVQAVGVQPADPLRREIGPTEQFLLAVGPKGEDAILYLVIPPPMLQEVTAIPPMTWVTVTARVRNGRSQPAGVPVLELQSIARE